MRDFSQAGYTAIISDLHLCEAEPVHPQFPLWKKYKTAEFFYDDVFANFLDHIEKEAAGEKIELVLNGDIFDFDSVTSLPEAPPYRMTWLERLRGLHPQREKSCYKIRAILKDHPDWVRSLREFIQRGHRAVFVVGNHDLELHYADVQEVIFEFLDLDENDRENVRFCEWFYISNKDTLIEHGNQYDPYCVCLDPIFPLVKKYNRVELRVPFGNLGTRYLINGMGYFNPHVDTNFIMSLKEYALIFFKYMVRSQPFLVWTWFWGSVVIFWQLMTDRLRPAIKDPMMVEEVSGNIAAKANATPGMVRQLHSLAFAPSSSSPLSLARELWLDRALIILLLAYLIVNVFLVVDSFINISPLWAIIPMVIFLPPFIFYSKLVGSNVSKYKEPQEEVIMQSSWITKASRIVYGHTHIVRHEVIGGIEHLNSGCWSPAFKDVECTKAVDQKTYVWIRPGANQQRESFLLHFTGSESKPVFKRISPNFK